MKLLYFFDSILLSAYFETNFYILQKNFGLIKLDPATYFVELAPVKITFFQIISVNGLFLIISAFILWIPLKIILNINPSQALNTR